MGLILKFCRWVFEKFAAAVLIVGLGLAAGATWFFLHDNVDFEESRRETIRTLNAERTKVVAALEDVHRRMDRTSAEISAEQEKTRQADKVIAQLKELESTWDRMFGNRVQQEANAQRLEEVTRLRTASVARVTSLQTEFTRTTWERDGLEIAQGKIDAKLREAETQPSKVMHYFELAWQRMRWWVLGVAVLYFVGPPVGKLMVYFWVAPVLEAGRPVRLRQDMEKFPEVTAGSVAAEVLLAPGERLWVRKKFLRTAQAELRRSSRLLLDWRIPFSCMASGLTKLEAIGHRGEQGEFRVALADQSEARGELAMITLAPRSAMVVRPSFLAGVILEKGKRLVIRRRWQLFRWQSWVALQFRFFEFVGPCRLAVASSRGVRMEELAERAGNERPARRASQDATIGFTPTLECKPIRTEKFWSYYRGTNPLFDVRFTGRGIFLQQPESADNGMKKAAGFWARTRSGVLKLFGL